jgi:CBS domain containing-hemolysin-like protein
MKKPDELQRMKVLEIITIMASLLGIILVLVHGNIYDYFFNLFSIKGILNFRLLYASLFLYSVLAFVIFTCLFFVGEKNPKIGIYNYIQGWLFLAMSADSYEWFNAEHPFTFTTKSASVIFFGALFGLWFLEKRKNIGRTGIE